MPVPGAIMLLLLSLLPTVLLIVSGPLSPLLMARWFLRVMLLGI